MITVTIGRDYSRRKPGDRFRYNYQWFEVVENNVEQKWMKAVSSEVECLFVYH